MVCPGQAAGAWRRSRQQLRPLCTAHPAAKQGRLRKARKNDMANRSYLYSLSHAPAFYGDRPDIISGLSEWAYGIPFIYRLLMSGDPRLCASLVSDGLGDDPPEQKTRLYAISSPFAPGLARVQRFAGIVKFLAAAAPGVDAQPTPVSRRSPSFFGRIEQIFAPSRAMAGAPPSPPVATQNIAVWLDEMSAFLCAHQHDFLLLETVELDTMSEDTEAGLRQCVETEIAHCRRVGAAFDALPASPEEAARELGRFARENNESPLDVFHGLRFDDECDSTRTGATDYPLGLSNWSDVLYFELLNRADFDAQRTAA